MPNRHFNKQVTHSREGGPTPAREPSGERTESGRDKPGFSFNGKGPGRVSADRSAGTKRCKDTPDREGL